MEVDQVDQDEDLAEIDEEEFKKRKFQRFGQREVLNVP